MASISSVKLQALVQSIFTKQYIEIATVTILVYDSCKSLPFFVPEYTAKSFHSNKHGQRGKKSCTKIRL